MSTFSKTHGRTIQDSFLAFHKNNPEILLMIVKECDRAVRAGKKRFSIKAIGNYIRWNVFIETKEDTLFTIGYEKKSFKLNDAYFSRYARMVIEKYPHFEKYIEMRDLRSL